VQPEQARHGGQQHGGHRTEHREPAPAAVRAERPHRQRLRLLGGGTGLDREHVGGRNTIQVRVDVPIQVRVDVPIPVPIQVPVDGPVDGPVDAPINQVHRAPGFVLAACDTSIPGRHDGRLDGGTLAWLRDVLTGTAPGTPVLIAFHHPPVELHVPFIDAIRQFGEQDLAALIEAHPDVVGVLCGHAHTPAVTTFAGRPLLVAPGVVSTLRLPWEHRAAPDDHVHLDLPPALAFHVLDGGRLTTHFRTVTV